VGVVKISLQGGETPVRLTVQVAVRCNWARKCLSSKATRPEGLSRIHYTDKMSLMILLLSIYHQFPSRLLSLFINELVLPTFCSINIARAF
jgi:hypothetical protein